MYVASVWKTHPPSYDIAGDLASNGPRILPFAIAEMRRVAAEEDLEVEILLVLIEEIQHAGFDLTGEDLASLESVVASMTDEEAKEEAREQMDYIRERAGP